MEPINEAEKFKPGMKVKIVGGETGYIERIGWNKVRVKILKKDAILGEGSFWFETRFVEEEEAEK